MTAYLSTCASPLGRIVLTSDGASLTGLYLERARVGPTDETDREVRDDAAPFAETKRQLAAYFAGTLTEFDLPLAPSGTPFQRRVWEALRAIPYGETISYAELAGLVGAPGAARAVGAANGRNPISIVVPCHRVVGSGGALTGYSGGLDRKAALLEFERAVRTCGPRPFGGPDAPQAHTGGS